ncbi:MAG: hypothetical protein PHY30_02445 [Candidatus Pacebacteria bacterium]|nr:hypothetical protein [Candidatus Paceibacterota bacterium]
MENKEKAFENSEILETSSLNKTLESQNFEVKENQNHEQVEKELSSLFQNERKRIGDSGAIKEAKAGNDMIAFEKRMEDLMIVAFTKNPEEAIKKASSYNNPYLLDEFHDRLIEELRKRNLNK